jgi:hypothetical protein
MYLHEIGEENDDLLILFFGENLQILMPVSKEVRLVQDPLGTVRALPEVSCHSFSYRRFEMHDSRASRKENSAV